MLKNIINAIEGKTLIITVSEDTINDIRDFSLNINEEVQKFQTSDLNLLHYSSKFNVGWDFSFFDNVIFYGFSDEFFVSPQGVQFQSRFKRVKRNPLFIKINS